MSNNIFAFELFRLLANEEPGSNILFSPYCVSSAVSMLLLAAEGDTKVQLENALSVNGSAEFHQKVASLQDAVVESLKIANKLFLEQSFAVKDQFKNDLARFYQASCALEDFISSPEESRQNVNKWVSEKTQEKIQDLMPPSSINCDTRLVLANAVYFEGKWEFPFDKARTVSQDFHIHKNKILPCCNKIVKVDMMWNKAQYLFTSDKKMKMLEMPYQNSPISMVIILPKGDLAKIEKSLDAQKFAELYGTLKQSEVNLGVPKFKLEFEKDLCDSFRKMGAGAMLSFEANLSGISDSNNLFVSEIAHKAFIAVDEEDTEAAAVTEILCVYYGVGFKAPPPPPEFICNKPFLFFLYHKPTQVVLFTGRMLDPTAQK